MHKYIYILTYICIHTYIYVTEKAKKESALIMPQKKIEEIVKPNFIKKRKKVDVEKDEKRSKPEVI
jgi:hypothetical protein